MSTVEEQIKAAITLSTAKERLAAFRGLRDQAIPSEITKVMDRDIADVVATDIRSKALKTGDQVPDFILPDVNGQPISIKSYLEKGPLILSFQRGSWCVYCNLELHGLAKVYPEIEAMGGAMIAISPELPGSKIDAHGLEVLSIDKNTFPFPLLSDVGNKVAKQFGLVHTLSPDLLAVYEMFGHGLLKANGESGASELPLPAVYVIDTGGRIRFHFIDEDYQVRNDPASLPELLRTLQ